MVSYKYKLDIICNDITLDLEFIIFGLISQNYELYILFTKIVKYHDTFLAHKIQ